MITQNKHCSCGKMIGHILLENKKSVIKPASGTEIVWSKLEKNIDQWSEPDFTLVTLIKCSCGKSTEIFATMY